MKTDEKYNNLLSEYRQLQLRVTQFSSTEQELKNTRKKLDEELEIYKRLSRYTSLAIKTSSPEELAAITVDSMIDIFEIEVAALHFKENIEGSTLFTAEGLTGLEIDPNSLHSDLQAYTKDFQSNNPIILQKDELSRSTTLNKFYNGIVIKHVQSDFSFCLAGFISVANSPLYYELTNRHKTIFNVFTQQVTALFTNLLNNRKITKQLEIIESSKRELQKLSLIATRTNNSVLITDNLGRIEWVNNAFESTSGYKLQEVIGQKPKDFLQDPNDTSEELNELKKALWERRKTNVTVSNYNKKGERYYNELEVIPINNEKGELMNFISIQRDKTSDIMFEREITRINQRLKRITDGLNIGIWEWDIESNTVSWNSILYEQYGVDKNAVEGKVYQFWQESIHPNDRARVLSETEAILNKRTNSIESTYRIIVSNSNEERILKCSTFSESDDEGNIKRLLGSSVDITTETQAKNNLVKSEEKYRGIIENIHLGLIEYDSKGNKVFANKRYYELTQTTKNNEFYWCKTPVRSLSDMKSKGLIIDYTKLNNSTYDLEISVSDDSSRNLMVNTTSFTNPVTNDNGHIAVLVDTSTEKALRKKLEGSLQERETLLDKINFLKTFYESILDHSPAKIAVLDPDFNIQYTNELLQIKEPIWTKSKGKSIYQLIGQNDDFSKSLEELIKNVQIACDNKTLLSFEQTDSIKHKERVILRSILPYYENSKLEHIIITGTDISELKKSERDLLTTNKALKKINSELDSFVYSVSHDLRSPLLSVKGILSLLTELNKFDTETQQYLNMIDSSINRLDGTIQEILEYSRNSRLDLNYKPFDIASAVKTIYDDIKYSTNTPVTLETRYYGPTTFNTDSSRLTTVLKNLIGNAIKYKNDNAPNPFVRVEFSRSSKSVEIRVIDNGQGISEKAQKKVFEMFFRANENSVGTGLGLYICKEIVNKLKGTITLHSKQKVGTEVTVSIPLKTD